MLTTNEIQMLEDLRERLANRLTELDNELSEDFTKLMAMPTDTDEEIEAYDLADEAYIEKDNLDEDLAEACQSITNLLHLAKRG